MLNAQISKSFDSSKTDAKMYKYLIIISFILLSSCCKDGMEVDRYVLSDDDKESIPYSINESVDFKYTNGFEFDLTVSSRETALKKTEIRHCGDDYLTFETLTVTLISNIPELDINLEVVPNKFNSFITISINGYYFHIDITSAPDIDNLTINGRKFENIYQADAHPSDTLVIKPKQVLYNKEVGIIQITMTDDEKFTIKE